MGHYSEMYYGGSTMRKINVDVVDGVVVVDFNGKRTAITSCEKFSAVKVINTFIAGPGSNIPCLYKEEDIKKEYIAAGDVLGCSVGTIAKIINGNIADTYIKPNYELIKRFGYQKGHKDYNLCNLAIKNKNLIQEYINDGNSHLAAFAMLSLNTYEAKALCGKGLWRSLCKNSKSRNDKIIMTIVTSGIIKHYIKHTCSFLQTMPSTILKFGDLLCRYRPDPGLMKKVLKHLNVPLYKLEIEHVIKCFDTYTDCKRMLGDDFKETWSYNRVVLEHDKAVAQLLTAQYSDNDFGYYKLIPTIIEDDEFTAKLVRSPLQLASLGKSQRHCVGSFVNHCSNGEFIVYQITDKEGTISTSGFFVKNHFIGNQHYFSCNKVVLDESRRVFNTKLVDTVIKEVKHKIVTNDWVLPLAKNQLILEEVDIQPAPVAVNIVENALPLDDIPW